VDPVLAVVLAAALSAFAAVVSPLLLSRMGAQQRSQEKAEDYARQDLVADRAKQDSKRVAEVATQAAEAAKLLLQSNADVAVAAAEAAGTINGKLEQIHDLVNSNMTAAMESELVALQGWLHLLKATDSDNATAADLAQRVQALTAKINDRFTQTRIADARLARAEKTV